MAMAWLAQHSLVFGRRTEAKAAGLRIICSHVPDKNTNEVRESDGNPAWT